MTDAPHFLFHRPTAWESAIECSTKVLAKTLAASGCKATYLEAPLDFVHLLKGHFGEYENWRASPRMENGVQVLKTATAMPVRDLWPLNTNAASAAKYQWSHPRLGDLMAKSDFGVPDVIWTTVPGSAAPLKRIFPDAKLAFHVIDYYPAFRGDAVRKLEARDYQVADRVFVIGTALQNYVAYDLGIPPNKVINLGQGVDLARFTNELSEPESIADLPKPRAVWTGVLNKGDQELFYQLSEDISQIGGSIILIGPNTHWLEKYIEESKCEVRWIPPQPAAKVPEFLAHRDIGIMLYDRERQAVYKGQNPLKLYEYAAAGLGIISTAHDEFETLSPPVKEVSAPSQIRGAIEYIVGNREQVAAESKRFATRFGWDRIVETILAEVKSLETTK